MSSDKIESLYKYRQVDDLSIDALKKGKLWYSKPAGLNDPHDVAPRWKKNFTDKEILEDYVMLRENNESSEGKGIAEKIKKMLSKGWSHERVLRKIDQILMAFDGKTQRAMLQDVLYYNETVFAGIGVLSLSEDPKHPVMWGAYGNSHKGFCLGFEYHETNVLGQYANTINYINKMPKPSIRLLAHDTGDDAIYQIAFTKSLEWEYEKEWRVLKTEGNGLYPYPGKLTEVVLGLNMSEEDEKKIRSAVEESGYKPVFLRLRKYVDEFGYELVPSDEC
ncbi:DUF2971 domain-containing protein [Psychromonas sp. Urea-02u-13]|uniref:DUF2971 domain-containing protein n=1 Tax=Psychromonas sp. Urea-02u-13 TaxID=2058326 RepID=UPI000C322879|nr:DUF2971 domain-containing protein [Psychromonas sp. Urea-02u-13]PKG38921.1 hypothetical protein CXF74_11225 [Psychromonas sp. Urea-02u-13]